MFPDPFDRIPDEAEIRDYHFIKELDDVEISDEESYGTSHGVTIELDEWAQVHAEILAWVRQNKSPVYSRVIAAKLSEMSTGALRIIAKFVRLL